MDRLNKVLKICIIVGILLISFSLFYYLVIRVKQREIKLENCLKKAERDKSVTFQSMKESKSVPQGFLESLDEWYKDDCNMCFKKYK